ncbi:MAG: universal stress protein [Rhodospirillales bacterium]|jgi:nucleotide-binding universal stress UspA family protein
MCILVAVDLSENSDIPVLRAAAIARQLKANLRVIHIVDSHLADTIRGQVVEAARSAITARLAKLSVDAHVEVRAGRLRSDVAQYAFDCSARLLVVGDHDARKDGLFTFGETSAARIMRSSPIPMLVVRTASTEPYRDIVVGVDFSIYSRSAIRHAREFAPIAKLHLVHAYVVPLRSRLGPPEYVAELEATAQRNLAGFLARDMQTILERTDLSPVEPNMVEQECLCGMPYEVIIAAVQRHQAGLVVVGTHGAGGVARVIWGSVATALVDSLPCDLMIVHEI